MTWRDGASRAIVLGLLAHLRGGSLELVDARGAATYGSPAREHGAAPLHARLEVHDPRTYERLLRATSVGLGESYAEGWWDTDDLVAVLRMALRSLRGTHARRDRLHRRLTPLIGPIERRHRPDPVRDVRNVRAHYDLGNAFFERLLDETMAYSCAIFDDEGVSLADASVAKFDRVARSLALSPRDHLLEIGTGWGGFAIHAAARYGCQVTTTTISAAQFELATTRVREAGLRDRVTVLDRHYLDVTGSFSKAAAIEVVEAIDWREYGRFFDAMRRVLPAGGSLAVQAIVVPDASFDRVKRHTDYIRAAVFPGGGLPSVASLDTAAEVSGFARRGIDRIGPHYGETLRRWRSNLEAMTDVLPSLGLDARLQRQWRFYLAYCEAGFDEHYLDDVQLLYSAVDAHRAGDLSRPSRRHAAVEV